MNNTELGRQQCVPGQLTMPSPRRRSQQESVVVIRGHHKQDLHSDARRDAQPSTHDKCLFVRIGKRPAAARASFAGANLQRRGRKFELRKLSIDQLNASDKALKREAPSASNVGAWEIERSRERSGVRDARADLFERADEMTAGIVRKFRRSVNLFFCPLSSSGPKP